MQTTMKTNEKIWLLISGILLIVLGVVCMCYPAQTLFATAWLIGCFTLLSGILRMVFTFKTERFMPNSGTRMLSGLFQVILGIFFLCNNLLVTLSLPLVFSLWVIMEGVFVAVQSFDYKKVGFPNWWALLLLGIVVVVLGFLCLRNLDAAGKTMSLMIGLGVILLGVAYLLGYIGLKRFENYVKEMRQVVDA